MSFYVSMNYTMSICLLEHVSQFTICLLLKLWDMIIVGIIPYKLVISLDAIEIPLFYSISILCPNSYIFFYYSLIVIILGLIYVLHV